MKHLKEEDLLLAKKKYFEDGFCCVREFVSTKSLKYLLFQLERIITFLKKEGDVGSYINFADKENSTVNSIHRLEEIDNKELNEFIHSYRFQDLAEFLTGEKCSLFSIQAFLKPPGKGLKTPAHQDNAYWCHSSYGGLTLWLSLDKAGRFNGMMKYGIGTNKKLLDHQLSTTTPGSSLIINESKLSNYSWFQPELNPGDIAIHDGMVVHYSEQNTSQTPRRGFLLNYRPNSFKRDQIKYEKYLKQLESIHNR